MTSWTRVIGIAILSPVLFAQWPSHATAGAPRTPDGKVDLTAPTPKAPDGHPDLSGVWDRGVAAGAPMASPAPASLPATAPSAPVSGFGPPPPGPRPFQNLPSLLPGGLPFQPWAA